MNQLVISLIILLIPGLIAAFIYDAITEHEKWNNFDFSAAVILFGWVSYLPLYIINIIFNITHIKFRFEIFITLLHLLNGKGVDNSIYMDIIAASLFAVIIAFIAAYCVNYKILTKLARYLKVSDKYGDENLFSYYLNSNEVDWIYVRCKNQNLIYSGKVNSHSESGNLQEIVLLDADVYNYENSSFLYSAKSIYLCGNAGDFIIELAQGRESFAKNKGDTHD